MGMIQANELRIGNWVNESVLGNGVVVEISKNSVWLEVPHLNIDKKFTTASYHITCAHLEPIPLTPEILVKCVNFGLTIKDGEKSWFNGDDIMIREADMALFLHSEVNGNVHFAATLKHLHQLQNLYFALTGTELEINL